MPRLVIRARSSDYDKYWREGCCSHRRGSVSVDMCWMPQVDSLMTGSHRHDDEGPRAYVVPVEGAKLKPEDVMHSVAMHMPAPKQLSGGVKIVPKLPRTEVSVDRSNVSEQELIMLGLQSGNISRQELRKWAIEELGPVDGSYHVGSLSTDHDTIRDYSVCVPRRLARPDSDNGHSAPSNT